MAIPVYVLHYFNLSINIGGVWLSSHYDFKSALSALDQLGFELLETWLGQAGFGTRAWQLKGEHGPYDDDIFFLLPKIGKIELQQSFTAFFKESLNNYSQHTYCNVVVNIKICLKTLLANHHERRRNCGVQYLTFKKNIDNESYVLLLKIDIDDKYL